MTQLVTVVRHARIVALTLNNPPVNALSHALRVLLLEQLAAAASDPEVDAIVIACAGRTFVAGADIREFGNPPLAPDLPEVVEFLDTLNKPVVAAIHGMALGGGLELALACHFRVATESARVGLPEVTLGILPGAGGTQRLPRLVGVRAALDLIVRGAIIPAARARALGLLDELVADELGARALAVAERLAAERRPLRRASELAVAPAEPGVFEEYERLADKDWRGFLAPSRCIQAVRAAVELPFAEGLARERALFIELMASSHSRAQRHLFLAEREVARVPGLPGETKARDVKSAAVVGSDTLAEGIARCFAAARVPVALLGLRPGDAELSLARIEAEYSRAVAIGQLKQREVTERLAVIRPVASYEELADADLIIDATAEDMSVKRDVFARLDAVCKPNAVLATSSPWMSLEQLASVTRRPEDVVVMHFIAPADTVRLLENARAPSSGHEACATVMKVGKTLGKVSVLVSAQAGLVGSRIQARRALEAVLLLEEGASAEQIDRALYDFGSPMGPPEGAGEAAAENPSRGSQSPAISARSIRDDIGELKGRAGAGREPAIERVLALGYRDRGGQRAITDGEILERCVFSMIGEAARVLDEQTATRPLEIDTICVHGYGFPVFRGGPLFYADELGPAAVHRAVLEYRRKVDEELWAPSPLLERLAETGGRFYAR